MTNPVTEIEMRRAVETLKKSNRGYNAMAAVLTMLDEGGIALDAPGQLALMTLLTAAWTGHGGTARNFMREAM